MLIQTTLKINLTLTFHLSETTDGGTTISTSFEIVDEGTVAADDDNAIKLTFLMDQLLNY